jgi:anti-anti-sigma regulatory factor
VTQSASGTIVCLVTGALTADTAPLLSQALATKGGGYHARHLVIDLSGVTSLDADGLYTLLVARHHHRASQGAHLALVLNPHSPTIAELYLVSLEACFEVHDTLAAALHACATTDVK